MKFKAAVVGLGNIGQGYDYARPAGDSAAVLTHALAFSSHPGFELIGGVDPEPELRKKFTSKFGKPAFSTLAEFNAQNKSDVIAIATPTNTHARLLDEALLHHPRAVLCEKPLAPTLAESRQMVDSARRANCLLLVNYMRRFEPGVLELKRRLAAGDLGQVYKGRVWYSKGLLNNGSHYIDLLAFLLGDATDPRLLDPGRALPDPEPDARIRFGSTDVYFLAGREECFSAKHLELFGTKGVAIYAEGGFSISLQGTKPSAVFEGYTVLEPKIQPIASDLGRYQWHTVEALYQALVNGAALSSTGETALQTLESVVRLIEMTQGKTHV